MSDTVTTPQARLVYALRRPAGSSRLHVAFGTLTLCRVTPGEPAEREAVPVCSGCLMAAARGRHCLGCWLCERFDAAHHYLSRRLAGTVHVSLIDGRRIMADQPMDPGEFAERTSLWTNVRWEQAVDGSRRSWVGMITA